MAACPIPEARLATIVQQTCATVFAGVEAYDHDLACKRWNQEIPNRVLQAIADELIRAPSSDDTTPAPSNITNSASSSEGSKPKAKPQFKFSIHSAIVQHTAPLNQLDPDTKEPVKLENELGDGEHRVTLKQESRGKRGMHVATCAIWNPDLDGVWNTKYDPGEGKDWDVVISVMWLSY